MADSTGTKMAISGLTVMFGETIVAATHAGGVGAIVALAAGAVVYNAISDIEKATGKDTPSLPVPVPTLSRRQQRVPGQPSLAYRLFHGKSTREDFDALPPADGDNQATHYSKDDFPDDFQGSRLDGSGAFTFFELLATGWRPSYNQIFLARLEDGTDVFVSVEKLVHIALAGSTRQGKTSIIRQLLAQLCSVGCCCILMDPHYTPFDVEIDEDWTPFTPFLRFDPLQCKSYDGIEQKLRHAATTILDTRKQRREDSKPLGVPIFMVIDEYPAIIAEKPEVQKHVAKLLREGAKYKIFLCIASQDFQVKTVSPQSGGAIRDNYKTCFYVGGDKTTANVLLDTSIEPRVEATLGKGPVMLRCETVKKAALARTPFVDNEALYRLLGPSTYQPSDEEEEEEAEDGGTYAAFDEDASQQPQIHQVQASKPQQKVYEPIPLPEAISAADKVADEKIANILRAQPELLEIGDARLTKALREQGYGKEATQYRVGRMKKLVRDELDELGELGDVEPETEGE